MKAWVLANAKALTALFAAAVTLIALRKGLRVDSTTADAIATLVVSALVYAVPNTPRIPSSERVTPQEGVK